MVVLYHDTPRDLGQSHERLLVHVFVFDVVSFYRAYIYIYRLDIKTKHYICDIRFCRDMAVHVWDTTISDWTSRILRLTRSSSERNNNGSTCSHRIKWVSKYRAKQPDETAADCMDVSTMYGRLLFMDPMDYTVRRTLPTQESLNSALFAHSWASLSILAHRTPYDGNHGGMSRM
jgi:hypothetical protein